MGERLTAAELRALLASPKIPIETVQRAVRSAIFYAEKYEANLRTNAAAARSYRERKRHAQES